ncbi:MAG: enoyl-CoA hydratase/isomerase family protein, partial [Acidobacteria bacterium]|nr:enoyl-CoA hydratase/isomerase family protein [Acidobacteriota bacterium]
MEEKQSVTYDERDGVALVTLDRAGRRNALTAGMLDRLAEIFASVRDRRDLRAVVLAGAGAHFCAGSDISELRTLDAAGARARSARGQEVCDAVERCGVPVIAAVRGAAAGGGCELALACHLRVAEEDAFFSLPETGLGLIPAYGGTQRLALTVGRPAALSAMLANERIAAPDALRLGLVNSVVPPGGARDRAEEL